MGRRKIKFDTTPEEAAIIRAIAERAVAQAADAGHHIDRRDVEMDVTAVHLNGCRLDLVKLRDAHPATFAHDLAGIYNCLDRKTGKLGRNFDPRCSMAEAA